MSEPLSPRRVLVTGVGAAPGLQTARALLKRGCEVVAVDADPLAFGLRLPGVLARTMPPVADPGYHDALVALCDQDRPDALIGGVEQEIPTLIDLAEELARLGVATWLPPLPATRACLNKAHFHEVMTAAGLPVPATWLPDRLAEIPSGLPLLVKPRGGQGGQGVIRCSTAAQARVLCELVTGPIVQERLAGWEFTADCLTDPAGRSSVILRHRQIVKGGLAVVATTFHHPAATDLVTRALAALEMEGVCCVQGFIDDGGRVVLTEANARLAGAFPVSEAAGADLLGQYLAALAGRPVDHGRLTYKAGVRLTTAPATLAIEETDTP
ncbi:protein of unknown function DUF201 [Parafrankia sp. EAN1pec]|uniref:ATP-grasp domain-containing protein n=1 Tax=Parafrankia sp. (strain EAN1pec) TaxID=298653 RepID=UPI00005440D1|nr:protein of unknown function DUF201 [Frankia sp. EAN1pec]